MITPIIMLVLLVAPAALGQMLRLRESQHEQARVLGVTLLFCFTGVSHFLRAESMARMLPEFLPAPVALVYLSGCAEIVLGIGVVPHRTRRLAGWTLLVILLVFLPVNVYAAINEVDVGGHEWGPIYLLIRIPLQLFIGLWIWRHAIARSIAAHEDASA